MLVKNVLVRYISLFGHMSRLVGLLQIKKKVFLISLFGYFAAQDLSQFGHISRRVGHLRTKKACLMLLFGHFAVRVRFAVRG